MDFYLTLFSNFGGGGFDIKNEPYSFKTKLLTPLHLSPSYECALVEVSWRNAFSNLNNANEAQFDFFDFLHKNADGKYGKLYQFWLTICIEKH